jgi:hypothetical protein
MLERVVRTPRVRLCDDSLTSLLRECHKPKVICGPVWLTGSACWLPAAFLEKPSRNGDLDLVFPTREDCEAFVANAVTRLNRGMPGGVIGGFTAADNAFGAGRIKHPDGTHVMDCWYTQPHECITEVLAGYPERLGLYTRCAYAVGWGGLLRDFKPKCSGEGATRDLYRSLF